MELKEPKIVCFEGIDGCGKTSLLRAFQKKLDDLVIPSQVVSMLPEGKIRQVVLEDNRISQKERAVLYAVAAEEAKRQVKEALEDGKWVLMDRGPISFDVYQGYVLGFTEEIKMLRAIFGDFIDIDYIAYISIDHELALKRIYQRSTLDAMESSLERFYNIVADGFRDRVTHLNLLKENNMVKTKTTIIELDGTVPIQGNAGLLLDHILFSGE